MDPGGNFGMGWSHGIVVGGRGSAVGESWERDFGEIKFILKIN